MAGSPRASRPWTGLTVRGICPSCQTVIQTHSEPNRLTWRGPCPDCGAYVIARRITEPLVIPRRRPDPPAPIARSKTMGQVVAEVVEDEVGPRSRVVAVEASASACSAPPRRDSLQEAAERPPGNGAESGESPARRSSRVGTGRRVRGSAPKAPRGSPYPDILGW